MAIKWNPVDSISPGSAQLKVVVTEPRVGSDTDPDGCDVRRRLTHVGEVVDEDDLQQLVGLCAVQDAVNGPQQHGPRFVVEDDDNTHSG